MNEEIEKSKIARYLVILLPLIYLVFYLIQGNFLLSGNTDHIDAQLTALFAAKKALAAGQFPLWNPYIFNGTPLWGSPSVFIWYPFTWIELLAPQSITLYVSTICSWLHYFAVFFAGFIFFREIIRDEKWASFSTLVYGFSIPVAYGLSVGNAYLPIYVYLPLFLYVFHTFERRGFNRNVIFISILFYLMITGGFLQLFVYAMLIVGLYILFLCIGLPSKNQKVLLLKISFFSVIIGILLSAPLWISTFYMSQFVSRVSGSFSNWQNLLNENYISELEQWLRLLLPNGFGFSMWNPEQPASPVETMVSFCGVSSLFLAGLAFLKCKDRIVGFWFGVFIFSLLLVYSPLKILQYLVFGGMDMMYGRILFLLPLSVACLAGMGGKNLLENDVVSRFRLLLLNPFNTLLLIVILTNSVRLNQLFKIVPLIEKLINQNSIIQLKELIPTMELIRFIVIVIALTIVFITKRNSKIIYTICTILLIVEVIPATYLMNRIQINPLMVSPSQKFFAYDNISQPLPYPSSYLEEYRLVISEANPSRKPYTSPYSAKDANQGSIYDYYSPWGYANGYSAHLATLIKTAGLMDTQDCPSGGEILGESDVSFSNSIRQVAFDPLCHPRLADLMSVGSVIKTDNEWKVIQENEDTALKRATLFYKYSVISNSIEASTKLAQDNFDINDVVILDRFPFGDVGPADPEVQVKFTKNTPDQIILEVKTRSPGMLLLNDSYYPGWKATVDNQPVEIIRANVAFRAVWIPEGEHRVVFSYAPPLFGISLLIGLLGVAALIILVNWTRIYIFVEGLRKRIKIDFCSLSEKKAFYIVCLTIPLLIYLIPLFSGYSWSSIGPNARNSLNPPEGYSGRVPDQMITVEPWGASVINVPFQIRMRNYIQNLELPLWNPYQGLGQPFAAQGEGSPYFPLEILRAVLPDSLANYPTIIGFFFGGLFLFLLLSEFGLSNASALLGSVAYMFSGALSLHIARPNIADQLTVIPLLFWAIAKAVKEKKVTWYALLSLVICAFLLAGFIQIAVLSLITAMLFGLLYTWWLQDSPRGKAINYSLLVGFIILGMGLAAHNIFIFIEAIKTCFTKNSYFFQYPMPYENLLAFFFPMVWGQFFESWISGGFPDAVDWNNLFSYASIGILLLNLAGFSITNWKNKLHRNLFFFFCLGGITLMLRYICAPGFDLLNYIPILNQQTPKHANGLAVFFFVISAAIVVEYISSWNIRRMLIVHIGAVLFLAFSVLFFVFQPGRADLVFINVDKACLYLTITCICMLGLMWFLFYTAKVSKSSELKAKFLVIVAVFAELSIYIPLGNSDVRFLLARIFIAFLILISGVLYISRKYSFGVLISVITITGYIALINLPRIGLPRQFEIGKPPAFMRWIQDKGDPNYRTFGIQPETSSMAEIQDIGVVGPFGLREFHNFVKLVGSGINLQLYEGSTVFTINGYMVFDLYQYIQKKPIFDWIGVKYLILDHSYFNSQELQNKVTFLSENGMQAAYEDNRVTIMESPSARPKVYFSSSFLVYPYQETINQALINDPELILDLPILGEDQIGNLKQDSQIRPTQIDLSLSSYSPNRLTIAVDAPSSGIVVIKDGYYPSWEATIDNTPTKVFRVNGMVRGVYIEKEGHYEIKMVYRPKRFLIGFWLLIAISIFLVTAVVYERKRPAIHFPYWLKISGVALVVIIIWFGLQAYFL